MKRPSHRHIRISTEILVSAIRPILGGNCQLPSSFLCRRRQGSSLLPLLLLVLSPSLLPLPRVLVHVVMPRARAPAGWGGCLVGGRLRGLLQILISLLCRFLCRSRPRETQPPSLCARLLVGDLRARDTRVDARWKLLFDLVNHPSTGRHADIRIHFNSF